NVQSRIIHCITAHGHFGEYYNRFVPIEPSTCPCDHRTLQTRDHILRDCPLHTHARHHLTRVSPTITLHIILSTPKGLHALQHFLEHSTAFLKNPSYAPNVIDPG
ncbi:hypothetical protein WOLCODRAFT_106417, partial [Wolfiporia cocos MD-104 SS10]